MTLGINSIVIIVIIVIIAGIVSKYDSTRECNFNLVEVDDWLELFSGDGDRLGYASGSNVLRKHEVSIPGR